MTRANFTIVTRSGKFKMQSNSSAYPSNMMGSIIRFATSSASKNAYFGGELGFYSEPDCRDIATFVDDCGLTFGSVGNPTYYYEIDFVNQHIKVWDTKSRWVNAPEDWKEKGWVGIYEGKNGRMGYEDCFVKGKVIYRTTFKELVADVVGHGVVELKEGVIEFAENISV